MRIEAVLQAIRDADRYGLLPGPHESVLSGLSGTALVGALQRFTRAFEGDGEVCYLEIGVLQGLTLLSTASSTPRMPCFGIDDFSILDPDGTNMSVVLRRRARLKADNAVLINQDFEAALGCLDEHIGERKIGVYFVDGAHDYRSQLVSLLFALPYLHKNAVVVVDDSNYRHVRQANRDFLISHPEYRLAFEAYTPAHPHHLDPDELDRARKGWWNGVNIIVRDLAGSLPEMLPPVHPDRQVYFNEHLVHRHGLAELAPQALALARDIVASGAGATLEQVDRFCEEADALFAKDPERLPNRNTWSAALPAMRFNQPRS